MSKDLIIGAASNYTYDQVSPWINSIKKSGFPGDIAMIITNMKTEDIEKIAQQGVDVMLYGQKDANGNYVNKSGMAPHVERFFYLWHYLRNCKTIYRNVIVTDVRDVIFQRDPSDFMSESLDYHSFIAAGEGLYYRDEPWGSQNYLQTFGPFFYDRMKDYEICNVGVIAGKHMLVNDLLLMIFQMSINRPIPVVDQAVYNFILRLNMVYTDTFFVSNNREWAINLGTTLPAIESGAGDLGMKIAQNPALKDEYLEKYITDQPIIKDGIVYDPVYEKPFIIVHQYDRVAGLAQEIREKYGDK